MRINEITNLSEATRVPPLWQDLPIADAMHAFKLGGDADAAPLQPR